MIEQAIDKARELATTPLVSPVINRNDIAPTTQELLGWARSAVEELQAEKLAHADSKSSRLFLETTLKIYQAVTEGMAFKGKEQEHELAIRRTRDIIGVGVNAWTTMQGLLPDDNV